MKKLNVIGRQVGRLRYQRGWTQEILAGRLQLAGWIISRSGISKIENGSVYVPHFRLPCLARLLGVATPDPFQLRHRKDRRPKPAKRLVPHLSIAGLKSSQIGFAS